MMVELVFLDNPKNFGNAHFSFTTSNPVLLRASKMVINRPMSYFALSGEGDIMFGFVMSVHTSVR